MKRFTAILLSVVMLVCSCAGLDFSAYAEDTTTIVISSEVENATSKMTFSYDVKINGAAFSGVAVGKKGDKYNVKSGKVSIPAKDKATITVPVNASYAIKRLKFKADGYEALPETTLSTGVASKYDYYEVIDDLSYPITEKEYNKATNNGTLSPAIVTYYVNEVNGERLKKSEVTTGTFYTALDEQKELGYKSGKEKSHSASLKITAALVEKTLLGKETYSYTGNISLKVADTTYSEDYKTTVPSTDKAQAKTNAAASVEALTRTIAARALNAISKDKDTSAYFTTELKGIMPTAADFGDSTSAKSITNQSLVIYEFVPYVKQVVLYTKEERKNGTEVVFGGELNKIHTHSYKSTVVKPTCTAKGYTLHECSCGDKYKDTYVDKKSHSYKDSVKTPATTKKDGVRVKACKSCGKTIESAIPRIKTITASASEYTYNGKVRKPSVTVKDSKGNKLKKDTDYTVAYSKGCKAVGEYKITITFKGSYKGTEAKKFVINPKGTTISKLTAKSKGFVVKWSKKTTQTTGYQIQYSTSSRFSNSKTATILKNSTTSTEVKRLTAGKKYYVRIRTFKTVSGTRYYSTWSEAKTVKTKK